MHAFTARLALIGLIALRQIGFGPHVDRTPDTDAPLTQLWDAPADIGHRDLLHGPTFPISPPHEGETFTHLSTKTKGFSPGFEVKDSEGREWSVKLGPEAQTEVVASRLLWAIGYHQPPVFYVDHWTLADGGSVDAQTGARFRPKGKEMKGEGAWAWQHNPFVNTTPFRGLIVMMLLLNSTDLRNQNNEVYDVRTAEGAHRERWFVVKDIGATFGETGVIRPVRNDVDAYEHEPLLNYDSEGHARFAYKGLQKELLPLVSASDVKWVCDWLDQLSPQQWHDAFRAGGYVDAIAARYIDALRDRVRIARTLDDRFTGDASDYWANRFVRATTATLKRLPALVH